MFGLTGDLGDKKLFPALHDLAAAGKLGVPVIGVGRSEHTDDDLRSMFRDALGESYLPDVADSIDLSYVSGDSTDAATYTTSRVASSMSGFPSSMPRCPRCVR